MKHFSGIVLLFLSLASCRTKQWRLDQSINWKPHVDLSVLYVRWRDVQQDTVLLQNKHSLDSSILDALERSRLGEIVENDSTSETERHFVVAKDYQKAVDTIVEVARMQSAEERIEVVKRAYETDDKWRDSIVYPVSQ
jgi:hypothetical protein